MHAVVKILLGLILIVVGFGLFIDSPSVSSSLGIWNSITGINWWNNLVVVVTGVIPALLILVGIFIVWLEGDEISAEKEIKAEEEHAEAKEVKNAVTAGRKPGKSRGRSKTKK